MDRQGQVGEHGEGSPVAAVVPTIVGILTVAGMPQPAASAHVERQVTKAAREGMLGGSVVPAELAVTALERASEPQPGAVPGDEPTPVETAVRSLPWADRLATLAAPVLGPTRLGAGRPDLVAEALGARVASWERPADDAQPLVTDLLEAAVRRRSPAPDPDLEARLAAASRRPLRTASLALVAVAVALVVGVLVAWRPWSDADPGPANDGRGIRQWVAVLETGPTPASLAGKAAELGRVVGVYVFTDRWACYEGFPGGPLGADEWFLGIGAVEQATVEELVIASGRKPLITTEVVQTCVLPPPSDFPAQP